MAAANSSNPPACSWEPGAIVKLACGFFFSWNWQRAGQAAGSSHSIELTDADAHLELLLEQALHSGTRNTGIGLAVLAHQGKDFSAEFDRVTVPSIGQRSFSFALHPLEQAIDCCPMHRDRTAYSGFPNGYSLLNLPDQLASGGLMRL